MEETLSALVGAVNLILWDYMLIYALLGIGLFFTLYLGAPQITKLGAGFKSVFGGLFSKKTKMINLCRNSKHSPSPSPPKSVRATSPAWQPPLPQAGRARFFGCGFPPFWGCPRFLPEALLAQKYRVVSHGKYIGGPAFYITHGLTPKIGRGAARFLSGFFSIALIIALGFIGNATQANSIASSVTIAF